MTGHVALPVFLLSAIALLLPLAALACGLRRPGIFVYPASGVAQGAQPRPPLALHASLGQQPGPSAATRAPRVLLVEDDPTNQLQIAHLVRLLGHPLEVADSGAQAMIALEQGPFAFALLDMDLPDTDGITLAETICRRWPPRDRPYLLALTASLAVGERERCLAAGMEDYLTKPVSLQALGRALAAPSMRPAELDPLALAPLPQSAGMDWAREWLENHGRQTFERVARLYLEDAARIVAAMGVAGATCRGAELARLAHKLKSSSAIVGAARLSRLCASLEAAAAAEDPGLWRAYVAAIEAEFQRVRGSLLAPGAGGAQREIG